MEIYATKQEEFCRAERGVGLGGQQNNLESCRAIVYNRKSINTAIYYLHTFFNTFEFR